jgi:hypothetical protein
MRSLWKSAILGAVLAVAAGFVSGSAAQAQDSSRSARSARSARSTRSAFDEQTALRAAARERIAEELRQRSVRPVPDAVIQADAARVAATLSGDRLHAVAEGLDVDTALSQYRLAVASALGDSTNDLLFVPLPPCRIIDTRSSSGGKMAAGETRNFQVAGTTEFGPQGGTLGGCGVPAGSAEPAAAAIMVNLVAVDPAGKGNLAAWAFGQPAPSAASINYALLNPAMNIANGLIVPIAGTNLATADLSIRASFSPVHVVADVTGYFTRFPIDQFQTASKSINVVSEGGEVDLSSGACTEVSSCTIDAPSTGKVIVRAWTQIRLNHGTNVGGDRIAVGVKNIDPTNCTNNDQSINATDFEVPDSLPAEPHVDWTMSHKRIYSQGKGIKTYYINAHVITGAGPGDLIQNSRLICTFIPD